MAWTYNTTVIREGRSWTNDDGIKHPTNWGSWSEEEKTEAGLVWGDDPAPFDSRFYWAADIPKALDDVHEVDEDGEPAYGPDGNPVITLGLKSQECAKVKAQAGGLLASTDWYVVRKAETDVAVPADVLTYRAAVRTHSGDLESAINACETHEAFMALFVSTEEQPSIFSNWPEM